MPETSDAAIPLNKVTVMVSMRDKGVIRGASDDREH